MNLGWWYERVDLLCLALDCSMTSSRRTAKRNASVGGATKSQHLTGQAWDVVPDDPSPERYKLVESKFKAAGFYTLLESDHLHVHIPREAEVPGE